MVIEDTIFTVTASDCQGSMFFDTIHISLIIDKLSINEL